MRSVVTIDKEILHGFPCFTASRVPVQTLIDFLESGEGIVDFLAVYPFITSKQILAFLELSRDITLEQAPMRVFLDACVDPRVVEAFSTHEVKTAFELNWHRLRDHELLPLLEDQFDALVTIDQGFEFEHNLKKLTFGIVIVHVPVNKVEFYRPIFPTLLASIERECVFACAGEVIHVSVPPLGPISTSEK